MITHYQYYLLPFQVKAEYTWEHGLFLLSREQDAYKYNLYWVHNFFVEVEYAKTTNEILQFRSFKSCMPLQPYLNQIKLVNLL